MMNVGFIIFTKYFVLKVDQDQMLAHRISKPMDSWAMQYRKIIFFYSHHLTILFFSLINLWYQLYQLSFRFIVRDYQPVLFHYKILNDLSHSGLNTKSHAGSKSPLLNLLLQGDYTLFILSWASSLLWSYQLLLSFLLHFGLVILKSWISIRLMIHY